MNKNSQFLKNIKIHPDWVDFFTVDILKLLAEIETEVTASEYTPSAEKVFLFLAQPLISAKVVIIGQDPYPQKDVATGRAFEVGTLKSWNQPFQNVSLKNILRSIYKAYTGNIIKYNELKTKFDNEFPVLPPNGFFKNWEKQGVLLLNTYLTCRIGEPGSHKTVWENFTRELFLFISEKNKSIVWFLWGAHAFQAVKNVPVLNSVKTLHPMMCFEKQGRENDFLYGEINCFNSLKEVIDWTGFGFSSPINKPNTLF